MSTSLTLTSALASAIVVAMVRAAAPPAQPGTWSKVIECGTYMHVLEGMDTEAAESFEGLFAEKSSDEG
jgi:hypothetical protein